MTKCIHKHVIYAVQQPTSDKDTVMSWCTNCGAAFVRGVNGTAWFQPQIYNTHRRDQVRTKEQRVEELKGVRRVVTHVRVLATLALRTATPNERTAISTVIDDMTKALDLRLTKMMMTPKEDDDD